MSTDELHSAARLTVPFAELEEAAADEQRAKRQAIVTSESDPRLTTGHT